MIKRQIQRLPGMRDVTAQQHERIRRAVDDLRSAFNEWGYQVIDTPLLEETELFVRKSGGEISGRLYTFTDPGGHRVSLRPEFTPSVIRHFVQEQGSLQTPVRWQYGGPVFRYDSREGTGYRQFTQVGAEFIGAPGPVADAEVVSLACAGLARIGFSDFQLRIGHLGLLMDLLETFNLSEAARLFVIGHVQALKSGETDVDALRDQAEESGLLRTGEDLAYSLFAGNATNEAAQDFIQGIMRESLTSPVGQRSTEQIISRLLRKVREANDPQTLESALRLVGELSPLDGPSSSVLQQARAIISRAGLATVPLDHLEALFDALAQRGQAMPAINLDLGLARGIAYYTGVIFELVARSPEGNEVSLGGGGRYDDLVKALGGDGDVPALGFAYNLDQVLAVSEALSGVPTESTV